MWKIILCLVMNIGFVYAETKTVHSVTPSHVKFTDGTVGFFDHLSYGVQEGDIVSVQINDETNGIKKIEFKAKAMDSVSVTSNKRREDAFYPTIISDYDQATRFLNSFRFPDIKDAQCYDRAHIWTYEAQTFNNIKLQKMWLFFSDHYIEEFRFKWWFHTAPFALVRMPDGVNERLMDKKFSQYPLKIKVWTDIFMKNKVNCREIRYYSDYSRHPGEDYCYLLRSTPYFWQPRDLEYYEQSGYQKTNYIRSEIQWSYRIGFGINVQ